MFSLGGPSVTGINVGPFTTNHIGFKKARIYWDNPQDPVLCIFENVTFPNGITEYENKKILSISVNDEIVSKLNELKEHVSSLAQYPSNPDRHYFPLRNNNFNVKVTEKSKIFRNDKESVEHIPKGIKGTAYVNLYNLWWTNNNTGFSFYLDAVYF